MKGSGRQSRFLRCVEESRQDLRHAIRGLREQPGFSLAATLTLALGLGLAVGLFAVVDAVLLQPLPFADQDDLVVLWEKDDTTGNPHIEVSLPNFEDWRTQGPSVAGRRRRGPAPDRDRGPSRFRRRSGVLTPTALYGLYIPVKSAEVIKRLRPRRLAAPQHEGQPPPFTCMTRSRAV